MDSFAAELSASLDQKQIILFIDFLSDQFECVFTSPHYWLEVQSSPGSLWPLCQRMLFTHSALHMNSSPPFVALVQKRNTGRNPNLLLPQQIGEEESAAVPALEEMPSKRTNKWKHDVLNKNSSIISFAFHLQLQYISTEYFFLETEMVSLRLKYLTRQLTTGLRKAIILDTDYFPCRQQVL